MFGLAVGDALGAHVEFRPHSYLVVNPVKDLEEGGTWGLARGQFTDDTSMALCLALSLIACQDFVPYDQLVRYKWWYRYGYMSSTGHCFDIGAATKDSIQEFEKRQKQFAHDHSIHLDQIDFLSNRDLLQAFDVKCSKEGVAGNGALMRLVPVPIFFFRHPVAAVEYSGISNVITHGDEKAYDACRYYGALIVAALHGANKNELTSNTFYDDHLIWFGHRALHPEVMTVARGSYKRPGGYQDGIRGKGYVINALEAALWAFWSDEDSFEKGALNAVNLGDDTDTTAAIYGQLAGAYYGYKKLPTKWLDCIYAKNFIHCVSTWIAYEGEHWFSNQTFSSIPSNTIVRKAVNSSGRIGHLYDGWQDHIIEFLATARWFDGHESKYEKSWLISKKQVELLLYWVRQADRPYLIHQWVQRAEYARLEVLQLIRPIMETMRNILRNHILHKDYSLFEKVFHGIHAFRDAHLKDEKTKFSSLQTRYNKSF
ncbi:unnamed protein product [Rotaria sordida]|uniref:ADP-ribosylhydrolase ARH3 n=1 Tax=Rotaria sordida TaxID=392033 RepID=A0A819LQH8_9BILA|nr:unnamed protein product [Rotaria sordida]